MPVLILVLAIRVRLKHTLQPALAQLALVCWTRLLEAVLRRLARGCRRRGARQKRRRCRQTAVLYAQCRLLHSMLRRRRIEALAVVLGAANCQSPNAGS